MKQKIILSLLILTLFACSSGKDAETKGAATLSIARNHLFEKQYDAARDSILSLRKNNPKALKARAAAILLLDSIEMEAAKDSAQWAEGDELERLQMKAQFFQRKLIEDQTKAQ